MTISIGSFDSWPQRPARAKLAPAADGFRAWSYFRLGTLLFVVQFTP
jgi:hypothetical protein